MSSHRKLQYSLAINEALHQMMEKDPSVFLIGQGVKSPWYVGNTAQGLLERFGENRIIDTPVSENGITGAAVGAAIAGMKPVVVHPRMDFMFFAMDPIINQAANWYYMNGGKASVPVVFWGIINRGGEQAAQHSQAIHGLFANIPGLKVVMPATAYDAKGSDDCRHSGSKSCGLCGRALVVSRWKTPFPKRFIPWRSEKASFVKKEKTLRSSRFH